jgi:Ca-activated chloride channel family protein
MGGLPATGLVRMLLWCAAAAMIILALARPQWGELPGEESVRTRDLVLALDVSDSMLATDLPPSRMARSIETAQRLLPLLEGNRVGVVVFAGEAYPLVPLTTDLDAVAVFLSGIYPGMVARPGSDIERAVAAALELLPPDGEGRVVVLVTDGENLQGNVDTAVSAIKDAGVGVLTVVAGTERGGPIPVKGPDGAVHHKRDKNGQPVITRAHPEVLAAVADAVGGASVDLADRDVVGQLARIVETLRTREIEANRTVQRVEQFPLFLLLAAACLVASFLLSPWRRLAVVTAMVGLLFAAPVGAQQGAQPASVPQPQPQPRRRPRSQLRYPSRRPGSGSFPAVLGGWPARASPSGSAGRLKARRAPLPERRCSIPRIPSGSMTWGRRSEPAVRSKRRPRSSSRPMRVAFPWPPTISARRCCRRNRPNPR